MSHSRARSSIKSTLESKKKWPWRNYQIVESCTPTVDILLLAIRNEQVDLEELQYVLFRLVSPEFDEALGALLETVEHHGLQNRTAGLFENIQATKSTKFLLLAHF